MKKTLAALLSCLFLAAALPQPRHCTPQKQTLQRIPASPEMSTETENETPQILC